MSTPGTVTHMTSSLLEVPVLSVTFLFVIGRYYVPPFVLAYALRDTNPGERAEIIKEINVFYRRRRARVSQSSDAHESSRQITDGE